MGCHLLVVNRRYIALWLRSFGLTRYQSIGGEPVRSRPHHRGNWTRKEAKQNSEAILGGLWEESGHYKSLEMALDRICVLAMQHRRKTLPLVAMYLAVNCITCYRRYDLVCDVDFCCNTFIFALTCVAWLACKKFMILKSVIHDDKCQTPHTIGQRLRVVVLHQ